MGNLLSQNPDTFYDKIFSSMEGLKTNIERINTEFKDNVLLYRFD